METFEIRGVEFKIVWCGDLKFKIQHDEVDIDSRNFGEIIFAELAKRDDEIYMREINEYVNGKPIPWSRSDHVRHKH